jgi:hypothetical protein
VALTINVVKANLRDDDANKILETINIQLLSMCIYRAPVITMKALDNESLSAKAFTQMLANQGRLEQSWQKRRFILGKSFVLFSSKQFVETCAIGKCDAVDHTHIQNGLETDQRDQYDSRGRTVA